MSPFLVLYVFMGAFLLNLYVSAKGPLRKKISKVSIAWFFITTFALAGPIFGVISVGATLGILLCVQLGTLLYGATITYQISKSLKLFRGFILIKLICCWGILLNSYFFSEYSLITTITFLLLSTLLLSQKKFVFVLVSIVSSILSLILVTDGLLFFADLGETITIWDILWCAAVGYSFPFFFYEFAVTITFLPGAKERGGTYIPRVKELYAHHMNRICRIRIDSYDLLLVVTLVLIPILILRMTSKFVNFHAWIILSLGPPLIGRAKVALRQYLVVRNKKTAAQMRVRRRNHGPATKYDK